MSKKSTLSWIIIFILGDNLQGCKSQCKRERGKRFLIKKEYFYHLYRVADEVYLEGCKNRAIFWILILLVTISATEPIFIAGTMWTFTERSVGNKNQLCCAPSPKSQPKQNKIMFWEMRIARKLEGYHCVLAWCTGQDDYGGKDNRAVIAVHDSNATEAGFRSAAHNELCGTYQLADLDFFGQPVIHALRALWLQWRKRNKNLSLFSIREMVQDS